MPTTDRPRVAVFAYSEVGHACLQTLLQQGANIAAVVTHPDDPDEEIWFHSVADLARAHGLPLCVAKKIGPEEAAFVAASAPELIFSFYFRALIPMPVLEAARLGAWNMHGALLPKYRGRACINWAVVNGETQTGVTLHEMTDKPDAGRIAGQTAFPIGPADTALDVFVRAAKEAGLLLERLLPALEAGTPDLTEQDEAAASYYGRRTPADGRIDWNKSAREIYNLVRGVTHPFPGAFTTIDGTKYFIWQAAPRPGSAAPGAIVRRSPLTFGTADGLLEALRIQPEGGLETDGSL